MSSARSGLFRGRPPRQTHRAHGHKDEGWFLTFRCYTNYVQLQFFNGRSLDPMPPKASKHAEVRYLDIRKDDDLDEDQLRSWIKQAADLPGEMM